MSRWFICVTSLCSSQLTHLPRLITITVPSNEYNSLMGAANLIFVGGRRGLTPDNVRRCEDGGIVI